MRIAGSPPNFFSIFLLLSLALMLIVLEGCVTVHTFYREESARNEESLGEFSVIDHQVYRLGDRLCVNLDVDASGVQQPLASQALRLSGELPLPGQMFRPEYGLNFHCKETIRGTKKPPRVPFIHYLQWKMFREGVSREVFGSGSGKGNCLAVRGGVVRTLASGAEVSTLVGCRDSRSGQVRWHPASSVDTGVPYVSSQSVVASLEPRLRDANRGNLSGLLLVQTCPRLRLNAEDGCLMLLSRETWDLVPVRPFYLPQGQIPRFYHERLLTLSDKLWPALGLPGQILLPQVMTIDTQCPVGSGCRYLAPPDWRQENS